MLNCSLAKWSDFNTKWFEDILEETNHKKKPYRKLWEYNLCIQAFKERNLLQPGNKGLVFGVGSEWTVSYFANKGCKIVATDMSSNNEKANSWIKGNQLCTSLEQLYNPNLISRDKFDKLVSFENVDMNNIPQRLNGFDFCWSLCALEHLGSGNHGFDFILNSLKCLKPGGWAFHTTEFDINSDCDIYETVDNVFYRKQEIETLVELLENKGFYIEPRNYELGNHINDYPNYEIQPDKRRLKLFSAIDHLVTSISLIIYKPL